MNHEVQDVLKEFNTIFIDILDNEDIELNPETTAEDIDEWDSLTHIQLIVAIEKHFKVKFNSLEIEGYKNVGDMCKGVSDKLSA